MEEGGLFAAHKLGKPGAGRPPSIETEAPRATSAYARKPVKSRYRAPTKASAKDEPPPGCTFRPERANGCDVPNFLARPCSTRFG